MEVILNNFDKIIAIILLITTSLYLRFLLQLVGQIWIKTIAHTSTLVLLPILTYVITHVISGNIALSLGMVGALSIVRFRNPVRSPLELTVYFGAITMGITAAVSLKWLFLLVVSITIVSILLYAIHKFTSLIKVNPFFISSFSEGNLVSTLYVVANKEIHELKIDNSLVSKTKNGKEFSYTLSNSNFQSLKLIEESLMKNDAILSIELSK